MSNEYSTEHQKRNLTAVASVISAVLASSCCIVPLVLISLGLSGAWISKLTYLNDYQPIFVLLTISFLAAGFWQVYRKSENVCDDDAICGTTKSIRLVKSALWGATILTILSLTVGIWAPLFY